jgi:hypothetical protein
MSEGMVRVLERTVMLLSPMFEVKDGRTRHVSSPYETDKAVVLLSTSGYYEESAFGPLVSQVEDLSRSHHRRFAGALLRPHGLALRYMQSNGLDVGDVLDSAQRAGSEMASTGRIREETLRGVRRPLLERDDFIRMMNSAFERREVLKTAEPRPSYAGRPEVGEYMKAKVFGPGARMRWDAFVCYATGEELGPKAMLEELQGEGQ